MILRFTVHFMRHTYLLIGLIKIKKTLKLWEKINY